MLARFKLIARASGLGGSTATEKVLPTLEAAAEVGVHLGDLIAALDVNPLMVLPKGQGVRAVDALVEFAS